MGQDALRDKLDSEHKGLPSKNEKTITVFDRSPYVVAWVLLRAKGKCECCDWKGFEKTKGVYFLEVHHLKPLADGGEDKIDNAAGVCPNCHRELHYGINKDELKKKLYANLDSKESTLCKFCKVRPATTRVEHWDTWGPNPLRSQYISACRECAIKNKQNHLT